MFRGKDESAGYAETYHCRVQLKCDGTQWRMGGEVKVKLANGVGSQYSTLPRNRVYPALLLMMRTPRLPVVDWTDAPADLNRPVCFAERWNLASACVSSHFKHSLPTVMCHENNFDLGSEGTRGSHTDECVWLVPDVFQLQAQWAKVQLWLVHVSQYYHILLNLYDYRVVNNFKCRFVWNW